MAPGNYTVSFCDEPCRHAHIGDFIGGWLTVVATPAEARLREHEARLREHME